ncbi:MAG: hypothetical protein A2Z29_07010 [Chloroflexi bacterium RBG_16_56_11]|nr:MAG: hypothetical protein A2Z29_07010 [Chloroflexi bacterium RBG_16_56_11]
MQVANAGRPVFVPIVYRLAARIEQTLLSDLVSDPTSYANAMEGAYKLLKQDAIVTSFDPSLEAEVFGGQVDWQEDYGLPVVADWATCDLATVNVDTSGRIKVMLEATKRLVQTRGKETAIIGAITGPCSLARSISEHAALDRDYPIEEIISLTGNQLIRLTRSICEVKVDALIIREDILTERYYPELLAHENAYRAVYATLFNLVRFYNVAGLLMVRGQKPEDLAALSKKLRPNGFIIGGLELNEADLTYLRDLSAAQKLAIGLPLPLEDRDEAMSRLKTIEEFITRFKPGGFFYTSDGEVPPEISLEAVREVSNRIKGVQET